MENYVVENEFNYKGFKCVVVFSREGFRYGSVGFSKEELDIIRLADVDLEEDIKCHGRLTYFYFGDKEIDKTYPIVSNLMWVEFDCGHCDDKPDFEIKYNLFGKNYDKFRRVSADFYDDNCIMRTKEFVEDECRSMVDQMIGMIDISVFKEKRDMYNKVVEDFESGKLKTSILRGEQDEN